MNASATFEILNTTSKENMRRNIRHALTQKSTSKFPQLDIHADIFENPTNLLAEFCHNFRNAGGKLIGCNQSNFVDHLHKLIVNQRFVTVLNTNQSLASKLAEKNINYITCVNSNQPVDVAIFYSKLLIARTGSLLFAQKYSLYPSVRNITKNIIVVAFEKNLVFDLKDTFVFQQEHNQGALYDFTEIITPTKSVEENYSILEPRFILLLIQ